ncbi:MAG: potassium transporter Kup [Gemmatimonadaceae bacterium]|nr:potassium transporter Kup [Gemmatimonadaceae bacterium]
MPADPAGSPSGSPPNAPTPFPGVTAAIPIPRTSHHAPQNPHGARLAVLTLTALGVVYGDIGTSPLYALQECFKPEYGLTADAATVYGVLSLILWSLILVVSFKYVSFILRADNNGEGGILAMLALILRKTETSSPRGRAALIALGLIGAALLYGDGIITPAISVLGAMEGLKIVSPRFSEFVVPVTIVIIVALFAVQRHGTHRVGAFFGPTMVIWFTTIAALGIREIARDAHILSAVNPMYAFAFITGHGIHGFVLLGAVILAVTGAEALYADMGHFGRKPIRLAWFWFVFPALLLNYFGQGSLLLRDPSAAVNPFYLLAPRAMLYPLIGIATAAAIIASQALISGAFSLTQQCVQLGYSPRVTIAHTSKHEAGQIYIPEVNIALAVGCVLVVLGFKEVANLGAAYGIAVTGTMAITTILYAVIMANRWNWPRWQVITLTTLFLIVDLAFFGANVIKIQHGGWVPLALAAVLFMMMTTWKRGRDILRDRLQRLSMPLSQFLESLNSSSIPRVQGTAVFLTSESFGVPVVLLHHLKHNKVLHQHVVLLSIRSEGIPEVAHQDRFVLVERLDHGFLKVIAHYGFNQTPSVPELITQLRHEHGLVARTMETSYYLGRELLIPKRETPADSLITMPYFRKKLFAVMARNARNAAEFFSLPAGRVVELGTQIEF